MSRTNLRKANLKRFCCHGESFVFCTKTWSKKVLGNILKISQYAVHDFLNAKNFGLLFEMYSYSTI